MRPLTHTQLDETYLTRRNALYHDHALSNDPVKRHQMDAVLSRGSEMCKWEIAPPEEIANIVDRKLADVTGTNDMSRAVGDRQTLNTAIDTACSKEKQNFRGNEEAEEDDDTASETSSNDSLTYSTLGIELEDAKSKIRSDGYLPNIPAQGVEEIKSILEEGIQRAANPRGETPQRIFKDVERRAGAAARESYSLENSNTQKATSTMPSGKTPRLRPSTPARLSPKRKRTSRSPSPSPKRQHKRTRSKLTSLLTMTFRGRKSPKKAPLVVPRLDAHSAYDFAPIDDRLVFGVQPRNPQIYLDIVDETLDQLKRNTSSAETMRLIEGYKAHVEKEVAKSSPSL